MATREIRTANVHVSCDVCGRTLLRGEHADTFLQGGMRRAVCELCAPRALREGWVREGEELEVEPPPSRGERRRGLLERLRGRREGEERAPAPAAGARDAAWEGAPASEPIPPDASASPAREAHPPAAPAAGGARRRDEPAAARAGRVVRAVPMSPRQRVEAAIACFNTSEHPRTVAGVARSLGEPTVAVRALEGPSGEVAIVVAWELSWYRYEVSLGDDEPAVRVAGQGHELEDLERDERESNAAVDEYGRLSAT